MGERSQIYVRYTDRTLNDEHLFSKRLIPLDYSWNMGDLMLTRVSTIMEQSLSPDKHTLFAHDFEQYPFLIDFIGDNCEEIYDDNTFRVGNIFKDLYDLSIVKNLPKDLNNHLFYGHDSDHGAVYIDICKSKREGKEPNINIKYCFTDYDGNYIGDCEKYMKWEFKGLSDNGIDWKEFLLNQRGHLAENFVDCDVVRRTEKATAKIEKLATLMSEEELKEFRNFDYSKYCRHFLISLYKNRQFNVLYKNFVNELQFYLETNSFTNDLNYTFDEFKAFAESFKEGEYMQLVMNHQVKNNEKVIAFIEEHTEDKNKDEYERF